MASAWPYLVKTVFPSEETINRDIALWAALGTFIIPVIASAQGEILASAATTGKKMSAGREQYNQEGYSNWWMMAIGGFLAIPFLIHYAGNVQSKFSSSKALM
mmetsp:Transcript_20863/g.62018  ORF Transcript_20863/g.62018 Transcript_20863/m.62018 type:complete len:103 (-) Transcript_20863:170-478(-)